MCATGQDLIDNEHYASDEVQQRIDELKELWRYLQDRSNDKGRMPFLFAKFCILQYLEFPTWKIAVLLGAFL